MRFLAVLCAITALLSSAVCLAEGRAKIIDKQSAINAVKSTPCTKGGTVGQFMEKKENVPAVKDLGWSVSVGAGLATVEKTIQVGNMRSPTIYKWSVDEAGKVTPLNGHAIGISK